MKDMKVRTIDSQNAEFTALTKLTFQWNRLQQVAVVDDDYPAVRRDYEAALRAFIEALIGNGRL